MLVGQTATFFRPVLTAQMFASIQPDLALKVLSHDDTSYLKGLLNDGEWSN